MDDGPGRPPAKVVKARTRRVLEGRTRRATAPNLTLTTLATLGTVVGTILIFRDLAHQPVLVTSLASSTFLLYFQPLNEINRLQPLVLGHVLAAGAGFAASHLLPVPYSSAAVGVTVTVFLMIVLRLVHPPAIGTSFAFAYRTHGASALAVFLLTLAVVVVLALTYLFLHVVVRPSRFAPHFGFDLALPWERDDAEARPSRPGPSPR